MSGLPIVDRDRLEALEGAAEVKAKRCIDGALGVTRVVAPHGALPQGADQLDAQTPPGAHECAVEVTHLNLDATSYRQIRDAQHGSGRGIARAIKETVSERGKMHNPITGSGGVAIGTVSEVGDRFPAAGPKEGQLIAILASLTATPLRLDSVGPVDPDSPQVPVAGRAILTARMPWAPLPRRLSLAIELAVLDVYSAASHTKRLACGCDHVVVIGAGRAGLLAIAAAKETLGDAGGVTALDKSPFAVRRAIDAAGADHGLPVDVTDAVATLDALRAADLPSGDLTVVCVNVDGCEAGAALITRDTGAVLFFSMATSFTKAALGTESFSSQAALLIGNGYATDVGQIAFELLGSRPGLLAAFEQAEHTQRSDGASGDAT